MAIRGINTQVEVQASLSTPAKTISAISKAPVGVVTSTAHGFSNGDVVVLTVNGMIQLNNVACRVASVATDTFQLEGIDTTAFGTFTSGTCVEVLTWDTFDSITNISLPNAAPAELDQTTVHDSALQTTFGLPGAPTGTMSGFFDPTDVAVTNLRNATLNSQNRVFRITFEDGKKAVFNSTPAAGQGFDLAVNALGTAQYSLTVRGFVNFYAS